MSERFEEDSQDVMLADARHEDFGSRMATTAPVMSTNHLMTARQVGDLFGTLMTAQPVIRPRDHKQLMTRLKALSATFGDTYEYAWDVNDKNSKRKDGKTTIAGPTIKLAMDLSREYGNCAIDIREIEGQTHWVFYARFTDLETGYSLTRAFRQRKNAMAGKYEDDRKLDMAYQNGQSKASRNVVVNALSNYVDYMRTEAAKAAIGSIQEDPKKFIDGINRGLEKFGVDLSRAEAMAGRVQKEWSPRDIAKVMNALKAINDGMVDARDAFPDDGEQVPEDKPAPAQTKNTKTSAKTDKPAAEKESPQDLNGSEGEAEPEDTPSREAPSVSSGEAENKPEPKAEKAKAEPAKKAPAPKPKALF